MTIEPIDVFASAIRFHDGGLADAAKFDPTQDGWQLAAVHAETDSDVHADHWEVHPEAEEVVVCLTGGIRLCFRADQQADKVITLTAGDAVIIPRGRWHRIELKEPSDILAVTVCQNTRLQTRTKA